LAAADSTLVGTFRRKRAPIPESQERRKGTLSYWKIEEFQALAGAVGAMR
jgi:hypothetical protein